MYPRHSQLPLLVLALLLSVTCSILESRSARGTYPEIDPPTKPPEPKPFDLADWTPRPPEGKAEPWQKWGDKEWADKRFQSMNTGPFQDATCKTSGMNGAFVYKATAVKLGAHGGAGVLFDRGTLSLAAGWSGGYLLHSDRRFGLLNTPTPAVGSKMIFTNTGTAGWADAKGIFTATPKATAPIAASIAKYRGLYIHDNHVVFSYTVDGVGILDSCEYFNGKGNGGIVRTLQVEANKTVLIMKIDATRAMNIPIGDRSRAYTLGYGDVPKTEAVDLTLYTKPGAARWGKPIVTKLVRSIDDGPFAIDTLTIPYDNPHKALFFCTGLDFLPDGRIAMCTCHGDVWLAKVDEKENTVTWQRYATGLYHPLGLKVVDGKVVVLERGQLTRLHDNNDDGEADFYECISNDWHTGPGEHSYDTCLETDPDGNFYFFKTGDTDLPSGGTLIKVYKDGGKVETFATGFRHPIGMGMSPTGIITGADQEGNWMPMTRIDQYKQGGFYGDMRAHHRATPPKTFDPPICWLPKEIDNSAGGQVWVPKGEFGPLSELPIHFSYGRCKAYLLLRQELADGTVQGGVADLGWQFLSGSCRGRFHPKDHNLYVCGLNGWQTAAKADGSLQRVRYIEKPLTMPVKMEVVEKGVKLTFTQDLDEDAAKNIANYKAAWWNYRYSGDYGSKRWKVSDPKAEGFDDVKLASAKLLDKRTVLLEMPGIQPVMQMQIGYNLADKDGKKFSGSVYLTIHKLAKE